MDDKDLKKDVKEEKAKEEKAKEEKAKEERRNTRNSKEIIRYRTKGKERIDKTDENYNPVMWGAFEEYGNIKEELNGLIQSNFKQMTSSFKLQKNYVF